MFKASISFIKEKSFNLNVRGKQILYKNHTSSPFLSGDAIANVCDVSIFARKKFSTAQIAQAKSIFCPSDRLEDLLENWADLISAKVLIFGNTDRDFFNLGCDFPTSVKSVYLQNSHISNSFFHTLPIGIENLRYGRNGLKSLFKPEHIKQEKIGRILVGPFSPTHPERLELNPWAEIKHPQLQVVSGHLKPKTLTTLASSFKFIACPRGNGTDTHRFWESLYRGSIPVVKRSSWSQSINQLGIPMLELNSWDFEEFLVRSEAFAFTEVNPEKIDILWLGYWEKLLKSDSE